MNSNKKVERCHVARNTSPVLRVWRAMEEPLSGEHLAVTAPRAKRRPSRTGLALAPTATARGEVRRPVECIAAQRGSAALHVLRCRETEVPTHAWANNPMLYVAPGLRDLRSGERMRGSHTAPVRTGRRRLVGAAVRREGGRFARRAGASVARRPPAALQEIPDRRRQRQRNGRRQTGLAETRQQRAAVQGALPCRMPCRHCTPGRRPRCAARRH